MFKHGRADVNSLIVRTLTRRLELCSVGSRLIRNTDASLRLGNALFKRIGIMSKTAFNCYTAHT